MKKKYKQIRVPIEIWETWKLRRDKIKDRIKITTKESKPVTMTSVFRYYGNRKIDIWDDELVDFFGKRKKKRKFSGSII